MNNQKLLIWMQVWYWSGKVDDVYFNIYPIIYFINNLQQVCFQSVRTPLCYVSWWINDDSIESINAKYLTCNRKTATWKDYFLNLEQEVTIMHSSS